MAARIVITDTLSIEESEIVETFVRSSGPGGQNVNKVSTAVQLRFDVRGSASLPRGVKERLQGLAGSRLTGDGVLVITANRFRSQLQNREDARTRLLELLVAAATPRKRRIATRPSLGERARRVDDKKRRSGVKALRQGRARADDD